MSAAPSLTHKLEAAAHSLNDAKVSHFGGVVAYAEAKRALELAQARLLLDGVTGSNKEQREAVMRLQLSEEHDALATAEDALSEARCALECAHLEWDLARYGVRALEVTSLDKAA